MHHPRPREFHEGLGHRRREEGRLARFRHRRAYLAQLRREPHLEQSIGLVEHRHLALAQVKVRHLAQVVSESSGRGDDDVGVGAQERELLLHRFSAVDPDEVEVASLDAVLTEVVQHPEGLDRQLPRGREYDRECRPRAPPPPRRSADAAAAAAVLAIVAAPRCEQPLQHGSEERHRRTAAGPRHDHGVGSREEHGKRFALDRRGRAVSQLLYAGVDGGGEVEGLESPTIRTILGFLLRQSQHCTTMITTYLLMYNIYYTVCLAETIYRCMG